MEEKMINLSKMIEEIPQYHPAILRNEEDKLLYKQLLRLQYITRTQSYIVSLLADTEEEREKALQDIMKPYYGILQFDQQLRLELAKGLENGDDV